MMSCQQQNIGYNAVWITLVLLWFANWHVDWAVVETGMGGRYDPSNVIPESLSIITGVGYDHIEALGPDLQSIAGHKAGTIKEHSFVITPSVDTSVRQVVRDEATARHASLYAYKDDFDFTIHEIRPKTTIMSIHASYHKYSHIPVRMHDTFQQKNTALAVSAVDILTKHHNAPFSSDVARHVLERLTYPRRMAVVQQEPMVILDGAHNPQKVHALVTSLKNTYVNRHIILILGFLLTKRYKSIVEILAPISDTFLGYPTVCLR